MALSTARLFCKPSISSGMTEPKQLRPEKPRLFLQIPAPLPPSPAPSSLTLPSTLPVQPDRLGRFGRFGGKFVPETIVYALGELEAAFLSFSRDQQFQKEIQEILRDYVGRESPLYFAERLTDHYKRSNGQGPQIYLKREDLNYTGAHTINNAVGQALLAKRLGKKRIIAETGNGQHGVSTAAICARLGLECIIYMGAEDMKTHCDSILKMNLLGAEVYMIFLK